METSLRQIPLAELAYHGVYNIYANFTSPDDVLSALYADVEALSTPMMGIDADPADASTGTSSMVLDASINPLFGRRSQSLQYDSFWTIGMTSFL